MGKQRRVPLGVGPNSKVALTHIIPQGQSSSPIHRIIAGNRRSRFSPTLNQVMLEGGTGGRKGTAEVIVFPSREAFIYREVPERYQRSGIGTDLLIAGEKIARHYGATFIYGETTNPRAKSTYERAGWRFIETYEAEDREGKKTFFRYGKRLT